MPLLSIMVIVSYFQNCQGLFVDYSSGAEYTLPSNSSIFLKRKVVGWLPIQFLTRARRAQLTWLCFPEIRKIFR